MTEIEIRIRTAFLRRRLRTHPPSEDNLDLYADLVKLERLVTETKLGAGRGLLLGLLRRRHPEAFRAMARELTPERFNAARLRQARVRRRRARQREVRKRRLERQRFLEQLRAASRQPDEG